MKRIYTDEQIKKIKFGLLTPRLRINKMENNGKQRIYWQCDCDCGGTKETREASLVHHRTQSCGCLNPSIQLKGNKHPHWRGCGELSAQHFNAIAFRAKQYRDIEFAITIEEAWEKFISQNGKCALSGLPIGFSTLRQQRKGTPQTASLDRRDSSKGYIPGNIQWVHKDVNLIKNHFAQDYFLSLCYIIAKQNMLETD